MKVIQLIYLLSPTKLQKLQDWRENQNQASSLQLCQKQRENRIKRSKLAYQLNYNKAAIPQSPPLVQYCQIFIMLDSGCLKLHLSSGISSVVPHNPHINAVFVYLFMQELFVDKFHFLKFLSMSDKPQLHQLKVINSSHSSIVQASPTI